VRAVLCLDDGGLESIELREVADPTIGPDQVLVEVHAASVEFVDTLIATGLYQIKVPTPYTPGNNLAGVVLAVGENVSGFGVGDRVHGMGFVGAFAEKAAVPAAALRHTPDGLSAELACLTGATYRTAYDALVSESAGVLKDGDDVVILGASGAVGSAAITVAKALGARVVACASSEEKLEFCRSIGADETVNYSQDGFKETLKQLCPKGVDIVLDPVGGQYSEKALRAVGYGGRFVAIGFASGSIPKIPLNLVLLKGSTITGYEIGDFQRLEPETAARNRDHLEAMLAAGTIKAPITKRFSMSQAVDAIAYVGGRDKFGMTVLTPQQ